MDSGNIKQAPINQPINLPTSSRINKPAPNPPSLKNNNLFILVIYLLVVLIIFFIGGAVILNRLNYSVEKPGDIPLERVVTVLPTFTPTPRPTGLPTVTPQASPTPDLSISWKNYTNNKFGYSFRYDPDPDLKQFSCSAVVSGQKGDDVVIFDEIDSKRPECAEGNYSWPISIFIRESPVNCNSTSSWQATQTVIKVGEEVAYKCGQNLISRAEQTSTVPAQLIYISIRHKDRFYEINLGDPKYTQTFEQILATLKFL